MLFSPVSYNPPLLAHLSVSFNNVWPGSEISKIGFEFFERGLAPDSLTYSPNRCMLRYI
jgi:hypothetical protein